MKITYIHQYFNTPKMPGSTRSYEMGRRLVQAGHEVEMITSVREVGRGTNWYTTDESGIKVHWFPVPYSNSMSFRQRAVAFFKFAIASSRKAASIKADVIFATSTPLTIAIPGAYAAWRRKCPMVFEVRDLWPEMPISIGALKNPFLIRLAQALERFAYRNSRYVIALSPGMADGVRATGFPGDRIRVIPNSCDMDLFANSQAGADRFRREHPELGTGPIVLYAGTLGRINNVDYLANVAACMRDLVSEARFVVIGEGSEREKVLSAATLQNVLGKNFFLYPPVIKSKISEAFSAASIVTSTVADIPAIENNSANKFFDGLAAGKPIAINYAGWQADILRDSGAGLVLSREPQIAAKQLADFLQSSCSIEQAQIAALKLAKERFSRDLLAEQLEAVLKDAVGNQSIR